jgi:hypothetical protein
MERVRGARARAIGGCLRSRCAGFSESGRATSNSSASGRSASYTSTDVDGSTVLIVSSGYYAPEKLHRTAWRDAVAAPVYSACSSTTTAKTMNAIHATENNAVLARNRPKPLMWITAWAARA